LIRLKRDALARLMHRHDIPSLRALGRRIGIGGSYLSRIRTGNRQASARVITAFLDHFPEIDFPDLFSTEPKNESLQQRNN
jgi:hypothetical protein